MIWNPDCDENPCLCPGDERATPGPVDAQMAKLKQAVTATSEEQAGLIAASVSIDESWSLTRALQNAWTWGYAAAQRDALTRPSSGTPEAASWAPTANPYAKDVVKFDCAVHEPVQHRDRKPPWCNNCGRDARGQLTGGPRAFGRRA